jgi:chorismate mutase / prephenate dehydrogenase
MDHDAQLSGLREAIYRVDRDLVECLRRRMDLAAEVGRIKAASGLPVVAREIEEIVVAGARGQAAACGISEDAMEAIFRTIIQGSVERQHRVGAAERARRGGSVLLLGGAGAMGTWFRRFLALVGHRVDSCDPAWPSLPPEPGRFNVLEQVRDLDSYDFILISVPPSLTPAVFGEAARRRPRGLLVEIASIKSHLGEALAQADSAGLRAASLHPMFGPGKPLYEPLTFVLACRRNEEEERAALEPLLSHPYSKLVALPFEHHDRLMGWLLGLAHLTGICFGSALSASGLAAEEMTACASTTFARQAATSRSVLGEDPDLYYEIQRLNPHRAEVYAAAREALDRLEGQIEGGDREGFKRTLAAAARALGET